MNLDKILVGSTYLLTAEGHILESTVLYKSDIKHSYDEETVYIYHKVKDPKNKIEYCEWYDEDSYIDVVLGIIDTEAFKKCFREEKLNRILNEE